MIPRSTVLCCLLRGARRVRHCFEGIGVASFIVPFGIRHQRPPIKHELWTPLRIIKSRPAPHIAVLGVCLSGPKNDEAGAV